MTNPRLQELAEKCLDAYVDAQTEWDEIEAFKSVIREAHELGRTQGPQWIPVNERLPEIKKHGDQFFSEDVLVADDDGALTIEFFSNGRWSGSTDTDHWTVTHWMPLPKPPVE